MSLRDIFYFGTAALRWRCGASRSVEHIHNLAREFKPDLAFLHSLAPTEYDRAVRLGVSIRLRGRIFKPRITAANAVCIDALEFENG